MFSECVSVKIGLVTRIVGYVAGYTRESVSSVFCFQIYVCSDWHQWLKHEEEIPTNNETHAVVCVCLFVCVNFTQW